MSPQQQAEEIRGQMARIRCDLEDDVSGIVKSARTMADWHYYVRNYPWQCLGLAVSLGYLIVPRRLELMRPDARTLAQLAKSNQLVVKQDEKPQKKKGLGAALFGLLANMVVRGSLAYLGQQAGRYWQQSMVPPQQQGPGVGPSVRSQ